MNFSVCFCLLFLFQSTPSVKRATYCVLCECYNICISIHALCEEGDTLTYYSTLIYLQFQSTPSVKRATMGIVELLKLRGISIHALCEEGDSVFIVNAYIIHISIHALCEEGDQNIHVLHIHPSHFNPRPL